MADARLDVAALYAALDQKRQSMAVSWRHVAREAGVSPSTLIRMGQGKRPDVDGLAVLLHWLGMPAESFLRTGEPPRERDTMAVISSHLRASKELSPASADALERIIRASYEGLRNKG